MPPEILTIAILTLLVAGAGAAEYLLHRRRLASIPVRVHVNGTRGKSSVTRLIAAGLRAGGIRTCAKTTGTTARMIMPDGSEYPVFRPAKANVIEQLRIISAAQANDCQALVVECMALQPYLQWLSEARMVRATHGVITNARPDHLEVMGPGERDVALALAGMTPHRGVLYTADQRHVDLLGGAAADRGSQLVAVSDQDLAAIGEQDLAGFSYVEHAQNLALALKICADLGVERQVALQGMWRARPDPGVMKDFELSFFGRRIVFVNAFAANDPESTQRVWEMSLDRHPRIERHIAVFNCRADRPERSLQLGRAVPGWRPAQRLVLMGTGTHLFARAAVRGGQDAASIAFADGLGTEQIFESIVEHCGSEALVVGMGNIGGQGMDLVRFFRNRSTLEVPRA
jgi:poly-gamma-glutamate synthase PgsB/CapB